MTRGKPTISDVARAAGVSKGLVSFALNDRPGVSEAARDRILAAAEELGWRPDLRARSLSTRQAFALGLVVRRDPEVIGSDPFFPLFISGIETVLSAEGQALVLSVVSDEASELQTYRTLAADRRVDGVFITDVRHRDPRFRLVDELNLPAVILGHPDVNAPFPSVTLDDRHGVREAVRHLIGLGHTRIAHVAGDPGMLHGQRRRRSFEATMREAGLSPQNVIETDFSPAQGADATRRLLESNDRPTAIVYSNDPMAIAGIGVAHQLGLRVPEDVSITGFDGTDMGAYVYPALTTVVSDPAEWGRAASRTLLQLIAESEAESLELPPAELLVRASTAEPSERPHDDDAPATSKEQSAATAAETMGKNR